jgi:hypothetical protein
MGKFTHPPAPATPDEFISAAEAVTALATTSDDFPPAGGPRAGALSLRLTLRETAVLRWLANHGRRSQHQIILDATQRALEDEYRRLASNPDFLL